MRFRLELGFRILASAVVYSGLVGSEAQSAEPKASSVKKSRVEVGREIFAREWIPGDKRSHGGDGLGPMFNESSCVACHNQGGVGGAGPASKNVDIVTAFHNQPRQNAAPQSVTEALFTSIFGNLDDTTKTTLTAEEQAAANKQLAKTRKQLFESDRKVLVNVHPGFSNALSVVLHKQGTFSGYDQWRSSMDGSGRHFGAVAHKKTEITLFDPSADSTTSNKDRKASGRSFRQQQMQMLNQMQFGNSMLRSRQIGRFAVTRSQRNTTALFGAGDIDAIAVKHLKAMEEAQKSNKEISGRVAMLPNGKIGRFGWKAQTASLQDFVLTACAVELGLNVPEHPQAGIPQKPEYKPAGLDLNAEQCDALIGYVGSLPAPAQRELANPTDAAYVKAGQQLFTTVGCAACHTENVGEAKGVYSDLLLHDLGENLGDTGSYGVFVPDSTPEGDQLQLTDKNGKPIIIGASRLEWRTPPLWGVRDSAPYLHDGRADTIAQAIVAHGGEATKSAQRFFALSDAEKFQMVTFMKSLVAPQ